MEHNSRPSTRLGPKSVATITTGVVAGMLLLILMRAARPISDPIHDTGADARTTTPPDVSAIDPRAVRAQAWSKIAPRLDEADVASTAGIQDAVAEIETFFVERKQGSRPLAEVLLSMKGKWKVIKSRISRVSDKLPFAEQDADLAFLHEKFGEHIFTIEDAQHVVEGAVRGYSQRLNAVENRLLVQIRADLSEGELAAVKVIPSLHSGALLRGEYDRLVGDVSQVLGGELAHDVQREIAALVGGEVAAQVAVRVAVGTRLGVSAGVLGAGAASSWATFGVGLVAAVVVDQAIGWIERVAGRDPVTAIAAKIDETLDHVRVLFADGDPDARQVYQRVRKLAAATTSQEARQEFLDAAQSIENSGNLGIRFELERMHELRKKVRREALRRLILGGET